MNAEIKLSAKDIKEIVANYMTSKGYNVTANDVRISVGEEWRGYGMNEYKEACFKGCYVNCKV